MRDCKSALLCLPSIVLGLVSCATISDKVELNDISYADHVIGGVTFTVERLHRLKLGDLESLENSMEFWIAVDAKVMFEILTYKNPTKEEKEKIYNTLRLLSVMNEKYEIEQWRSDAELLSIFKKAQENDPAHTAKFRFFNWSKPMWLDTDGCT